MSTRPAVLPLTEVSGAEAVWLLEGSTPVWPVHVQQEQAAARPARPVREFGRRIVHIPTPPAAVPLSATCPGDDVDAVTDTGWALTATGPADVITDPDEADHCQRTLPAWVHGPHDIVVRISPQSATGFRCARATGG
ncbi:pyridoxamine 5'-phosphate oxidase family protein [Streptomyces canus]|uniref:pyridoxamine 5'-phosphate oxidase family protein n=1 Tax=Streptomyces canus TaxID=58343 RepID=UPI002256610C|nr:pyridoxamine 5'-phosphate oxidase family protein [Streptomyces canus]MCX4854053.1 pyridoxamine 5'-phosphate oxidase family protein [Streptomyces canus]WSW40485.1 pyridoxamine 5'-phosphate oxidase family protein [Streptomyces canus]